MDPIERCERLLRVHGSELYHGESVTQLEHALQCATLAEEAGAPTELMAASLLHDLGHLLAPWRGQGDPCPGDDHHEQMGARFLELRFGRAVSEPVRLHVAAKRWLCTVEPGYGQRLSLASVTSLQVQGGPMNAAERAGFQAEPYARLAIQLRRWDEQAKVAKKATPDLDHFLRQLDALRVERARYAGTAHSR